MELEALKLKDLKTKNYLFQAIDRVILETILSKDTSKQIWDSMKKKYQGNTKAKRVQLQTLRIKFETLRMKSSESVTDYFARTMAITNKMRIHGENLEDVTIIEKILRSMTTKFNFVVYCIEESKDIDAISIDEKVTQHGEEAEAEAEVEEAMIAAVNNNITSTKKINFKEEEEDEEATHQQLKGQSQQTNLMLNATNVIDGVCRVRDAKLGLIAQVKMTANRMFPLYLQNLTHSCFSTKSKDMAWLWHFRYGHLNFGGLKTLQQKNMVAGLPQITTPSEVCEECVVGKQHRDSFPKGKSWRAKDILELEKSKAFSTLKKFMTLVEKEADKSIKFFRSDCGGEYNSQEFINFCEEHGIQKQLTAAYTPQQNGVSERKNRTILNMVRSILTRSGIPKSIWPEAVN
ncbi:uncharacterized protein [Coffea arabica]|uniref:Integrase catalytic domain-containing protein n=1 Tax=Coffea arabica TaxID=13443 RepID=A0ABM4WP99_COFAR